MDSWMEKILLDLNRISRVAVIEQAFGVEKMLRNYTKLLKYRWSYEGKTVTAQMELNHVEMLMDYYQVKWSNELKFQMQIQADTNSMLIPHYVFCNTVVNCLEQIELISTEAIQTTLLVSIKEENIVITVSFHGNMNFNKVREKLLVNESIGYDTFFSAQARWIEHYGIDSVNMEAKDKEYLKIQFQMPK